MIWATIKTTKEGKHFWKDAPRGVGYLRNLHRHIFYIQLWVEQKHEERDIEYIQEKERLDDYLNGVSMEGGFSCETMANAIKIHWERLYPDRQIKVGVWEDNENGTIVE